MDNLNIGDEGGSSWNIVPSMDVQAETMNNLAETMAQGNLGQTPATPAETLTSGQKLLNDLFDKKKDVDPIAQANASLVTRAIANQGQLLPIPAQNPNKADEDVKKLAEKLTGIQGQTPTPAPAQSNSGSGGGSVIGDVLGGVVSSLISWIICTELYKQGKMPTRLYIKGGPVFAAYSEIGKNGYYLWAIPCVMHLRCYPNSWFSGFLALIFLWRAEFVASRSVADRLKHWKGAIVSAILYPSCHVIGYTMWLFGVRDLNWFERVYGAKA